VFVSVNQQGENVQSYAEGFRLSRSSHSISVIVPVNNGGRDFVKCLVGLLSASPAPREIIVVDDGSVDNSWHEALRLGVRLVRTPVSEGPAKARNRGAREATGDILLFIDADVVVPLDLIDKVSQSFEREPRLAAVIGSYDDDPEAKNFLSQYKNLFHHFTHQRANEEASTFWGACGAIRRDIFVGTGGFDESYRKPCVEDIELGYRLSAAGHRIRLLKSLQVKHLKRWDCGSLLASDFCCRALPWTALIMRYRRFTKDLNLQTSSRMSVVAVYASLICSAGAFIHLGSLALSFAFVALMLFLNRSLVRFFYDRHGFRFAFKAAAWHYFYYFYSGLAFALGTVLFLLHGKRRA
jgi:GT2 family glycosyltransferase